MSMAIEKHAAQNGVQPQGSFDAFIERAASDPAFDVEKVRALLEMRAKEFDRAAERAFNAAMRDAQAEMSPVVRDAENSHTRSKYARLETIDAAIRPIYARHGFALSFNSDDGTQDGKLLIECLVMHDAGHTKRYSLRGALDTTGPGGKSNKTDIQGLGSAASYLRRYLTCMIFNVTLRGEDNDGNRPGPYISEQQVNNLTDMLAETGSDQLKFLAVFGAKTLGELRQDLYPGAMAMLRAKLGARK